jgi:ribosomal protein S25
MSATKKPNIGQTKPAAHRNANVSAERYAIERLLAAIPRDQTLSVEQIAARLEITTAAARARLAQMRHECLAVNTAHRGAKALWRLSIIGRRTLLGDEAWRAEEAQQAEATEVKPTSVAGPRTYNPAKAKPGTLSPWAGGTPVREGAMVAFALPSRGIKA